MGYEPQTLGKMSWCCEARSHALQIALLTGVHVHLEVQNTIANDIKISLKSISMQICHSLVREIILLANSNVKQAVYGQINLHVGQFLPTLCEPKNVVWFNQQVKDNNIFALHMSVHTF